MTRRSSQVSGMRGFRCSWCGKLRLLTIRGQNYQIRGNKTHKLQCQECGHTHFDMCDKGKLKRELAKIKDAKKEHTRKGSDGIRHY